MEIKHVNTSVQGLFKAVEDGHKAGLMTYSWAGNNLFVINHTEVNPEYSGRGVGKQLVMAAVKYARENNLRIKPVCPFAKATFDKTPEIRDVLYTPSN